MNNPFIKAARDAVYKDFAFAVKPAVYNAQPSQSITAEGKVEVVERAYKFKAIFVDFNNDQNAPSDLQDGDRKCILPMFGIKFQPKTSETIDQGGVEYNIVSVWTDPTGEALWLIQLRKVA